MMNASSKLERPLSVLVRILGTSLLALLLLLAVRPPASAQEACMDHSELSSMLGQRRSLGRAGPEHARSGSVAMSDASSPPIRRREA